MISTQEPKPRKVILGHLVLTPAATDNLGTHIVVDVVGRHSRGDWGDVSLEERTINNLALQQGQAVQSRYLEPHGRIIRLLTSPNREWTQVSIQRPDSLMGQGYEEVDLLSGLLGTLVIHSHHAKDAASLRESLYFAYEHAKSAPEEVLEELRQAGRQVPCTQHPWSHRDNMNESTKGVRQSLRTIEPNHWAGYTYLGHRDEQPPILPCQEIPNKTVHSLGAMLTYLQENEHNLLDSDSYAPNHIFWHIRWLNLWRQHCVYF